ncbi:MAG: U32 family peptidase [Acidaminobacteraceae bacterium]
MSRYFNGKEVELLAPVGNFEILSHLIDSKADAFYLGGKELNMRMHRKNFNFTNTELKDAVSLIHSKNKKVYITVNNLINEDELEFALNYLRYLEYIKPDAIIVQDMSVIKLINDNNIDLEIHSSVMMNVHNIYMIKALKELGVTRVVASREMDLKTVKLLKSQCDMEFEYFTHGDMCVAHGSQCHYSSTIFNMSSNRGRCMKPCRWKFAIEFSGKIYDAGFPLAVKDLCMYENMPELINSGVTSFKIEGRMRSHDYLLNLINIYSDSIDRFISDPFSFLRDKDFEYLYENRKRDLSTAFAFGNPGLENINERYEGTGKFYSTGKVFSKPIEEFSKSQERIYEIKTYINEHLNNVADANSDSFIKEANNNKPALSIKVNNFEQAILAAKEGVDIIYINFSGFIPNNDIKLADMKILKLSYPDTKFMLALPKMSYEDDHNIIEHIAKNALDALDGFLITNLGQLNLLNDFNYEIYGDYTLNIFNSSSADFYNELALDRFTYSIESGLKNLIDIKSNIGISSELIVHGSPSVMYLDHNIFDNIDSDIYAKEIEISKSKKRLLSLNLVDSLGTKHPILIDDKNRNHMLLSKELCYIDIVDDLSKLGLSSLRIEASNSSLDEIKTLIRAYKYAIYKEDILSLKSQYNKVISQNKYGLGALQFN